MKKKTRRYLFASYESIDQEGFDQFHLICDRMFVFVSEQQQSIPLSTVIKLQKLGKGLRWIKASSADLKTNNYLLSFMLGKLHERLPSDIEFAVLSDSEDFDDLIDLINRKGRNCLRILSYGALESDVEYTESTEVHSTTNGTPHKVAAPISYMETPEKSYIEKFPKENTSSQLVETEDKSIRAKAVKITNWLMKSGNRPAEIGLLKQYISLNNPDLEPGNAEKIITFMAMSNDIQIEDKSVIYNF